MLKRIQEIVNALRELNGQIMALTHSLANLETTLNKIDKE